MPLAKMGDRGCRWVGGLAIPVAAVAPPTPAAAATKEAKKDLEESNDSAADAKEVDDAMNVDEPEEGQQASVQEQQDSSEQSTRPDLAAPRLPSQAQQDEVRKSSWWSTWRVPTDSETLRKIAEQVSTSSTDQAASKESEGSEPAEASADSNRLSQVSNGLQQAANKYVPQAASSRLSGLWNTLNATEPPPPGQQEPVAEEQATEDSETKPVEAQAEAAESSGASPDPPGPSAAVAGQSGWSRWIPYPYWSKEQQQEQEQAQDAEAKSTSPASPSKDEEMAPPPLTPAEQVKADALARPDPSEATTALPVGDGNASNNNSAERGSWYSYFPSVRPSRPTSTAETRDDASMNVDAQSDSKDKSGASQDTAKQVMQSKALAAGTLGAQKAKGVLSSARSTASSSDAAEPKPDPAPPTDQPTAPLTGNAAYKVRDRTKKVRPVRAPVPNLVLPSFDDTFGRPPRSLPPPAGMLKRTLSAVNAWLSSKPADAARLRTAPRAIASGSRQTLANAMDAGAAQAEEAALRLPRSWETMGFRSKADKKGTSGIHKVCIVSLHGWFAQSWASRFMGENRGTSNKFALEMREAVSRHFAQIEGMELNAEAITMMPLSADGTVQVRVDKSFATLIGNKDWVSDLAKADAIIFVAHSQGCPVSTTLLARLIEQGFIHPRKTRMALLGMCGIHSGPFEHLRTTVVNSYVNYLETPAAKELFDFSDPKSEVSKKYEAAFRFILNSGTKVVLVASTDDQVVPLHSALFTAANHPSILRALYIHGASFPKLDFLTNMLTFCVAVRNAGLPDHNLLGLLSASVAGSLYGGLGHSLCYDEPKTYDLAVQYLFQATHPLHEPTTKSDEIHPPKLSVETSALMGNSKLNSNPHLLPWSLRGLFEDSAVRATFGDEIGKVLDDFEQWKPNTKTLKELAFRLEPMRSVPRPPKREDELLQVEEAKQSKRKGGAGSDDDTASVGPSTSKGAAKL